MHVHDDRRLERIGMPEAVLCSAKSPRHLEVIVNDLSAAGTPTLFTRLAPALFAELAPNTRKRLSYAELSETATINGQLPERPGVSVAVVAAGTSDERVALEARDTLRFSGIAAETIVDVGVAGLWRLEGRLEDISAADVVIAVAGMDAALVTVLGGLVGSPIIGVPTSVGYGVSAGGGAALNSALASCAQGVTVVNIDNGFGAACAAIRILAMGSNPAVDD